MRVNTRAPYALEQLTERGYATAIDYLDDLSAQGGAVFIPHRESDGFQKEHQRPLHERAEVFLDTLFRRLDRGKGFVLTVGEDPPVYVEEGLCRKLIKISTDMDLGIISC